MTISFKQLRIFFVSFIILVYPLNYFKVISPEVGYVIFRICFGGMLVLLTIESIKDKELAMGGATLARDKSPKIYWITIIGSIIINVIFNVYTLYIIIEAFA
jgi:hypothetical protein